MDVKLNNEVQKLSSDDDLEKMAFELLTKIEEYEIEFLIKMQQIYDRFKQSKICRVRNCFEKQI